MVESKGLNLQTLQSHVGEVTNPRMQIPELRAVPFDDDVRGYVVANGRSAEVDNRVDEESCEIGICL